MQKRSSDTRKLAENNVSFFTMQSQDLQKILSILVLINWTQLIVLSHWLVPSWVDKLPRIDCYVISLLHENNYYS